MVREEKVGDSRMGFLDNITFERGLEKPRHKKSADKTAIWIKNFTDYLSNQKAALKSIEKNPDNSQRRGKGKRSKAHTFWHEEKERYVFVPRYGTKNVALKVDRDGTVWDQVSAASLEEMATVIDSLIDATKNGDLNTALAQAAARPRKSAAGSGDGNQPPKADPASDEKPSAPAQEVKPTVPTPSTPAPASSGTSNRHKNRS